MGDDLGLFEETHPRGPGRHSARSPDDRARTRRRRRLSWLAVALVLLAGLGVGGVVVTRTVLGIVKVPDYSGSGSGDVIVQVRDGESTSAIAATLAERDVVASARAFLDAARDEQRIRSVQPGYYRLHRRMSAAAAVGMLLDPASRVGQLEIRAGTQLDDARMPDGTVTPGVLALISRATCAELNGQSTCVSVEQLRTVMAQADLAALGVPSWAVTEASRAEPGRRLEGLIMPGRYDVLPGSGPEDVLRAVVTTSAAELADTGLAADAAGTGLSPYQVLIVASLVEREGVTGDFPKIARVIYNRLAAPMRLQLDSTINYPLDNPTLLTDPADRERPGPYNTYLNLGLPPTPIGSPSVAAITAALHPADGPWLYFVKCQTDGTSCFSVTQEQHDAARRDAIARGVY